MTWKNETLDDLILLRSDGTPTYMLAVVVDDHDMGVTHVIRGDDHLTNAARQTLIYRAMDWQVPVMAHIPLIHGSDGAKLSKRHGALGVDAYRDMGYLPEAMRNYLARLGWSHGNDEFFTTEPGDRLVRPHPSRQGAGAIRLRQARGAVGAAHPRRRRRGAALGDRSLSCSAKEAASDRDRPRPDAAGDAGAEDPCEDYTANS